MVVMARLWHLAKPMLLRDVCAVPTATRCALGFGVLLLLTVTVGPCRIAAAADHPMEASVLDIQDAGDRQRLRLSTPSPFHLPGVSPDLTGAVLQVGNPLTGEVGYLLLPPGDGWSRSASGTSYAYNGRANGDVSPPVRSLRLKEGGRLKLVTRATGITLDEGSQGRLSVVLAMGGDRYCWACVGTRRDAPGDFSANRCSAPVACPGAQTVTTQTVTTTTARPTVTTTTVRPTTTTSTLVDAQPPSVPANVVATGATCDRVDVRWNACADAGGSGLRGYNLYRNGVFAKQVAAPATSTSDLGLAASTVYAHRVSAVDNAGNESPQSATASANTPACGTGGTSGAHLWSRRFGGTQYTDAVVPYGVATDASGNVVATGVFYGRVDFGTGAVTSAGGGDMFVAKYSSAGVPQWVRRFGAAENQFGTAVGTDANGNVYVTGYFFGTIDFGGGALASAGSYDVVVAKYSASGAHVWSRRFGGTGFELPQALAVDAQGNVLVAGHFAGAVNFGGALLTSTGSNDGFVAKYSPTGTHVWSRRVGGAGLDTVTGLGVDGAGNPTIVGYFAGTASFGGANLTSAGSNDVFVARYSGAGAHQWSSRFGDAQDQRAYGAAVDAAGNVALTGYFYGTMNFGGSALLLTGSSADIFLAKLNATGGHVWSKRFGTTLNSGEVGQAVAIDTAGNVILTGEINRDVDLGGGPLTAPASYDVFVAKFTAAGVHRWSKRFVAKWDDHGSAVAVDGGGNLILNGDFYEAVNFGGATLTSPGSTDGFIAKLAP
jgi:hypothetical protein